MEDETYLLLLLVTVMLTGSYLAGSIPLVMKLSEEKLKMVTVLGAGLLVGTALTVIIPEGIRSLYSESAIRQHHHGGQNPVDGFTSNDAALPDGGHYNVGGGLGVSRADFISNVARQLNSDAHHSFENSGENISQDHSRAIGLSLVLGFVFMLLIDQLSQRSQSQTADKNITATLGLVVHAAADGVALGAAATTSHQDVEMIVFLAIMLHKAPAAFGLVSFLLHEKIERTKIRKHLIIFSLSAPLLTLLTFFGIGQDQKETLNSVNATGIAMLFSAGTFLYVATVHVLPELTQGVAGGGHSHGGGGPNQFDNAGIIYTAVDGETGDGENINVSVRLPPHAAQTHKGLGNMELTMMIVGALLPLVITFSHQH